MAKKKWAQLGGIIRYELLIQWRRRGLLVLMIVLAVAVLLVEWNAGKTNRTFRKEFEATGMVITSQIERAQGTVGMYMTWPAAMVLMILAVPPIVADVLPRDQQYKTSELVHSLPVGQGTWLAGKLLASWIGLCTGLIGVIIFSACAGRLLVGPFHLDDYLKYWSLGILPLALFSSGMSILLASGQPNRRRATFVGVMFSAYGVFMLATTTGTVWDTISLARPSIFFAIPFDYNPLDILSDQGIVSLPAYQIPLTIGLGALQVVLTWLIVWAWRRWKESR